MIDRSTCLRWLYASRTAGETKFGLALAGDWVSVWPGDLEVQWLMAQAETEAERTEAGTERLQEIIEADPEFAPAYSLLSQTYGQTGQEDRAGICDAIFASLTGSPSTQGEPPEWSTVLRDSVAALASGDLKRALSSSEAALNAMPDSPLPLMLNIKARMQLGDGSSAFALSEAGGRRWQDCVFFRVLSAQALVEKGSMERATRALHHLVSLDPTGRLTSRTLGEDHPFAALWPKRLEIDFRRPIPAQVGAALGLNRISAMGSAPNVPESAQEDLQEDAPAASAKEGERLKDLPTPEPWEAFRGPDAGLAPTTQPEDADTLLEAQEEFDKIAARLRMPARFGDEDARSPAYVLLTSRTKLTQEFGEGKFERIHASMEDLQQAVMHRPGWTAYILALDDPTSMAHFGLTPADPGNAWQIKHRISDLDAVLADRGEMIGALLIVGGHRIVPFHFLPNPTEDIDTDVPSDNPYASSDENYLAPEWSVGRLPVDEDPDLLVDLLKGMIHNHLSAAEPLPKSQRFRVWIRDLLNRILGLRPDAMGYSASIWRRASMDVFRSIGEPRALLTSPPLQAAQLPPAFIRPVRLSYYNLHGVEDAPEWFGQRDPLYDEEEELEHDFPVALRPMDVINSGRAPKIVFTEACYGAHAIGKTVDSALCLKFLASGSQAVIGSTKISYGSISPPLLAADLLGRLFWDHLNRRLPTGEALRRAKLKLAADMHRKQGYLDGEDQKAIISFVLYGDPLFELPGASRSPGHKSIIRRRTRPTRMKTACALSGPDLLDEVDPMTLERVKSIVSKYLPGMNDAQCHIRKQFQTCSGSGHSCPTHELGTKARPGPREETLVVTFSKMKPQHDRRHLHYARLTMNSKGKVLKLAVSR